MLVHYSWNACPFKKGKEEEWIWERGCCRGETWEERRKGKSWSGCNIWENTFFKREIKESYDHIRYDYITVYTYICLYVCAYINHLQIYVNIHLHTYMLFIYLYKYTFACTYYLHIFKNIHMHTHIYVRKKEREVLHSPDWPWTHTILPASRKWWN